ncbi:hypothetical protein H0H93_007882 [Arthromyces matolae]|nr:hypothetical protein H0H93_007882 [Arthromyces matolae]
MRLIFALTASYGAASTTSTPPFVDGLAPFHYQGETFQTYWKIFGSLDSGKTPLVVLHGGPGLSHDYLVPFADLTGQNNTPVILYDQLGNAKSTHLDSKPQSFWNIDLFIDELVNLLEFFNIEHSFDLAGHSWGGILAAEFVVQRNPHGLRHLIISSAPASSELMGESHMQLLQAFPKWVQVDFEAGMSDPQNFYAALQVYYAVHACTVKPLPAEYNYTLDTVFGPNGDVTVASATFLNGWTIIDRIHLLQVTTLLINGRADIVQDFVIVPYFENMPKVKWITFQLSSHMPFWEERESYFQVVSDFLAL